MAAGQLGVGRRRGRLLERQHLGVDVPPLIGLGEQPSIEPRSSRSSSISASSMTLPVRCPSRSLALDRIALRRAARTGVVRHGPSSHRSGVAVRATMTRVRACLGLTIAACVCTASCSLLVQFHDQPGGDDASAAEDAPDDSGKPVTDASMADEPDASVVDSAPPMKEAGVKPDHYAPCSGLVNGYYCANDGPTAFAGPPSDLLYCDEGGIGQAYTCDGGCLESARSRSPTRAIRASGSPMALYCGRNLRGLPRLQRRLSHPVPDRQHRPAGRLRPRVRLERKDVEL